MHDVPVPVQSGLRRLARRLALGLFLEQWPRWAVPGLLLSGLIALTCRMLIPSAAPLVPWLWLTPVVTTLPALLVCYRRAYSRGDVAAVADWLAGGHGILLTSAERDDRAWRESPLFRRGSAFTLPHVRPWKAMRTVLAAMAFLGLAVSLPQRTRAAVETAVADEVGRDLEGTIGELKAQELITPDEEQKLREEIERIRRSAQQRVDAASWEAVDALREQMAAGLSEKQDAVRWAQDILARAAADAQGASGISEGTAAELMQALQKLERSGMLAAAPSELRRALERGTLPADAKALQQLAAALAKHLEGSARRFDELARMGKGFGRFDPEAFPLESELASTVGKRPGRGGVDRGRADAPLTWGTETAPFDRFKASPLPPGAARNADDWAPLVQLPGVPRESAAIGGRGAARQYGPSAGGSAWRRDLAPRHHRAVKKYFDK